MAKAHVLLVDDDTELTKVVGWYLEAEGFTVTRVADGTTALHTCRTERPELAIIDLMMPGLDGFQLCQAIREFSEMPILILSARDSEVEKVRALNLGADDYVTKPFSAMELVARVKALLRRTKSTATSTLCSPGLSVNIDQRKVVAHGQEVALSALEFDLLATLMRQSQRVFSRLQLAELVWGDDFSGDERLIDSHIYHLRDKLTTAGVVPCPIVTVRGAGYAFRP